MKHITKGYPKIGKGYWQSGYGRGFKKTATVYLIDGKAWVRGTGYHNTKEGFIPVNIDKTYNKFHQLGPLEQHADFDKIS